MSAEILRKAAALMRERAEAAADRTNTPWEVTEAVGQNRDQRRTLGEFSLVHDNAAEVAILRGFRDEREPVAYHIASWPPAVALAVAAWLDCVAAPFDQMWEADEDGILWGYDLDGDSLRFDESQDSLALAVARAYLGGHQ